MELEPLCSVGTGVSIDANEHAKRDAIQFGAWPAQHALNATYYYLGS